MQAIEQVAISSGDATSKSYESASIKVEQTRIALGELNAEMERIGKAKETDLSEFYPDPAQLDRAVAGALNADKAYQKLGARYDTLSVKLKQQQVAQESAKQAAIDSSGTQSAEYARQEKKLAGLIVKQDQLKSRMEAVAAAPEKATKSMDKFATVTKKANREVQRTTKSTNGLGSAVQKFGKRIAQLAIAALVFNVIRRALSELRKYLVGLLMTNQDFVNSLNKIKVNMATAFQPIYEEILPALNRLMATLANVTAYMAAFTSAMFGKTYQQSKDAAEALNEQSEAMEKLKKQTKKTGDGLATFDQIQKNAADQEDGFSDLFGQVESPEIDTTFIDTIRDKLLDIWQVFKDAWDNVGQYVMDGWQYALNEVWGLIKDIAATFLSVWTDGHGQATLEALLTLLGTIWYIIGDIARAFRDAWSTYGYEVVVSLFNMFKDVFDLINSIGVAFREAWNNNLGVSIASNILQIFTNINNAIGTLATKLREAWEANGNGVAIWQAILGIVDSILGFINQITGATAAWASELNLTPLVTGFRNLLDSINPVVDIILDGLAWAYTNVLLPFGKWLLELVVPVALDILAGAFDVIYEVIKALQPFALWLWENFLQPIGKWTGDILVKALGLVADGLKAIADWISKHQGLVETLAIIVGSFAAAWGLVNIAIGIWNGIGAIATVVTGAFGAAVAFLTSPIGLVTIAIGALIAIIVLLVKNWDFVKAAGAAAWDAIKYIWNAAGAWFKLVVIDPISNFFSALWSGVMSAAKSMFDGIKKLFEGLGNILKTPFKAAISLINTVLKAITGAINFIIGALNKLNIKIPDWVPNFGGKNFSFNIPKLPEFQIPQLATGTVLPGGAPYMAWVNDQPRGQTNIEAPMETIKQGVREVLSEMGGGLNNNIPSQPINLILELNGTTLGRILFPYIQQEGGRIGISMATSGGTF